MSTKQRVSQLCNKLIVLGYYPYQVTKIIQSAIGAGDLDTLNFDQQLQLIDVLQAYEKLGNEFLLAYSK